MMLEDRNFHDCEIKSVTFRNKDVIMNIFDPVDFNYVRLEFSDVSLFILSTDHTQNVIESINLYAEVNEIDFSDKKLGVYTVDLVNNSYDPLLRSRRIYHIFPITGSDTIIFCKKANLVIE